jgi:hypothetical protein
MNSCELKGHLPALKIICQEWKRNIELYQQVIQNIYFITFRRE